MIDFQVVHRKREGGLCAAFVNFSAGFSRSVVLESSDQEIQAADYIALDFSVSKDALVPLAVFPGDAAGFAQAIVYCRVHVEYDYGWYVKSPRGVVGPLSRRSDAVNAQKVCGEKSHIMFYRKPR